MRNGGNPATYTTGTSGNPVPMPEIQWRIAKHGRWPYAAITWIFEEMCALFGHPQACAVLNYRGGLASRVYHWASTRETIWEPLQAMTNDTTPRTAAGREFAEGMKPWWVHSEDDFDEEGWEVSILEPVLRIEAEAASLRPLATSQSAEASRQRDALTAGRLARVLRGMGDPAPQIADYADLIVARCRALAASQDDE